MSKVTAIVTELRQNFAQGLYQAQSRFLSVRELAEQYRTSINSANKILQSLEDFGLLTSSPKRGFFVNAAKSAKAVTIDAMPDFCAHSHLADRANHIRLWAETVSTRATVRLDLATASPDFYPTHKLQTIHNRLARHQPQIFTEYAIGGGLPQLREQITQHYASCALHPDDVLITHGATQALMLALQASTQAGDWVLIESPTYFGFLQLLDTLQLNAVEMPIDIATGVQPADTQAAIEHAAQHNRHISACLLQANFHNPTGASIALNVREAILTLCAEHNITVIEDDTFGDLPHHGTSRPPPLKALDKFGNVILCSSLSKLIAPGLRIGFVAGGRWYGRIKTLQHATTIACATMPQAVLSEFMHSNYTAYRKKLRATCRANIRTAQNIIQTHFPDGTQVSNPLGGYLLWVTLPAQIQADALLQTAIEQHSIAFAHGGLFSSQHQNALRLNCALMSQTSEQAGLRVLGELAKSLIPPPNVA